MSLFSNSCQSPEIDLAFHQIEPYAQKLGGLLVDTAEFQAYVRLERAVNLDPQVRDLTDKIHTLEMAYFSTTDEEGNTLDSLRAQLEAQPVVIEFRRAERAVRELFTEVDAIISRQAGMPFAENTRFVFT